MELSRIPPHQLGETFAQAIVDSSIELPHLIERIRSLGKSEFKEALSAAAEKIRVACGSSEDGVANDLFSALDSLDDVLGLDYVGEDLVENAPERVYAGARGGVQSSYVTLVWTLEKIAATPNATLVDLGSGYGRVGLFMALLRPDMRFIGYEYVQSRVECANQSAERAGLSDRVKFHTQDLSDPAFEMPEADFYYLWDPFTPETYRTVIEKLVEIGSKKKIAIITKGNAGQWVADRLKVSNWTTEQFDLGNLRIFWS